MSNSRKVKVLDLDFWGALYPSGFPCIKEKSGKLNFFQGHGILESVREIRNFWKMLGKCHGI